MKCSPTRDDGSLPPTWHCSDCSHGLTLPRGAQEVKFFLVLRGRRASQNDFDSTLMTTTKVDLKHGTRMISLLGLLGELRVILLVESSTVPGSWSVVSRC